MKRALILAIVGHPAGVLAQESPAPATTDKAAFPAAPDSPGDTAAPSAEAKDIVRLKNGGMVRGTIIELLPGESVTITTTLGKTREFPMSEVSYAGPADKDTAADGQGDVSGEETAPEPKKSGHRKRFSRARPRAETAPRPYVTVHSEEARLALSGQPSGVVFYRQGASATAGNVTAQGYERLCAAPCEITMPSGVETLALSDGKSKPVEAEPVEIPEGRSSVYGTYENRKGFRIAGWVSLGIGLIGGPILMAIPQTRQNCHYEEVLDDDVCFPEVTFPYFGTGLAVGIGGLLGGLLVFVPDSAEIQVSGKRAPAVALRAPGFRYTTAF